jgi:hypothetical protein
LNPLKSIFTLPEGTVFAEVTTTLYSYVSPATAGLRVLVTVVVVWSSGTGGFVTSKVPSAEASKP